MSRRSVGARALIALIWSLLFPPVAFFLGAAALSACKREGDEEGVMMSRLALINASVSMVIITCLSFIAWLLLTQLV